MLIEVRKMLKRILRKARHFENKDSQYKFIQKVGILQAEEAFIKAFSMCNDLPIYKYYKNLQADNQKLNKIARIASVNNSSTTMFLRYKGYLISKKQNFYTIDIYVTFT